METWGELFWDAWIRLRLAFRRLTRAYWPPQFKAWQICTVTGIVSIFLTLVVLNLPSKSESADKSKTQAATGKAKPSKLASTKAKAKPKVDKDPFADMETEVTAPEVAVDDEAGPPTQTVTFDRENEQSDAAMVRDSSKQSDLVDDSANPSTTLVEPTFDATTPGRSVAAVDDGIATTEPDATLETETTEFQPAESKEVPQPVADEPAETEATTDVAPAKETGPALEVPARDPKHYGRFGHHEDKEEERHPVTNLRATPLKDLPPPIRHAPLMSPVHPKGHYARLGQHEDSEEDRHSVREIRATRTDNVAFPGAKVGNIATTTKEPTPEQAPAEEAASPVTLAPPKTPVQETVPEEVPATEEVWPQAITETVPNDFDMPAETTTEVEAEKPALEPVVTDAVEPEPVDAGPQPPVLIAPEPEPEVATNPRREYHGPVHSTEASDHEAHQDEDVFSRPPRKPKSDWPEPAVVPPATAEPQQPTDAPAVQEQPATVEQPVEEPVQTPAEQPAEEPFGQEAAETPATSKRTTPRVITHEYEDSQPATETENPHLEEDRVIPMAVPDQDVPMKPERITIPDRLPPEESSYPTNPQGSEFTVARPSVSEAPAPKLVMEITGPKQVPVGTQAVMHFKVQNVGTAVATGIVVSDVLPPGLQHKLSSDLEYIVARLEPGESKETNLTVQCTTAGTIKNRATLRADGDVITDAEISLEVVKATTRRGNAPPPPESPLTVRHHGPERWLIDSTGQFLITVTNTTNQTLQNVTITQLYPQGTNLVHATVGNKIDAKARSVAWTISEFAPGVSYILETELHSMTSGPTTSTVRIKVGNTEVAEDKWTAVSYDTIASKPRP